MEPKSVISQADSGNKNREEKIDWTWKQEAHLGLLISADRHMLFSIAPKVNTTQQEIYTLLHITEVINRSTLALLIDVTVYMKNCEFAPVLHKHF